MHFSIRMCRKRIKEAEKYFADYESRRCAPTAYAKAQGASPAKDCKTASGKASCLWWLRSPGDYSYCAAYVYCDGSGRANGSLVNFDINCVRPALWIDLES